MIQYRSYPIYIVYSRHSQISVDNTAATFYIQGDHHMYDWMKTTGKSILEISEDAGPVYRPEVEAYENLIKVQLDKIYETKVGQCLLNLLNPDTKIWIHPNPNLFWAAVTYPAKTLKERWGIRIHFNPEQWIGTVDDTLIHELTHALRNSNNRVDRRTSLSLGDFPNLEEFLATQISNVYRSAIGKKQLYGTYNYHEGKFSNKGAIYSEFIDNPSFIIALKYCLDREILALQISKFSTGQPDFNPFLDFPILKRMALGKLRQSGSGAFEFMWI